MKSTPLIFFYANGRASLPRPSWRKKADAHPVVVRVPTKQDAGSRPGILATPVGFSGRSLIGPHRADGGASELHATSVVDDRELHLALVVGGHLSKAAWA